MLKLWHNFGIQFGIQFGFQVDTTGLSSTTKKFFRLVFNANSIAI